MTWQGLPNKLEVYIILLSSIAVPLVFYAFRDLLQNHHEGGWIVLTVLTILTVPFFLMLPSVDTAVGIGDAYVMAVAMMYGSSPCIIATLCHSLAGSLLIPNRPKVYPYRVVFNIAGTVCVAWIYSNLYLWMNPGLSTAVGEIILPAVMLTTVFFVLNSVTTATAISLASGQKMFKFWVQHYLPLAVDFTVSAVSATFIVSLYNFSRYTPLGVAPFIGVVWGWNKVNKAKAMEAERHLREQEELYLRTVESLGLAVDAKDQTTYGHIRRVRAYAMGLAKLCGIKDKNELMAIETGSLLHDIGKLAIDDYILNKPGRLSKQEFEKMKMHAAAGDEILQQIKFPFPVAKYVRYHHERWDGKGYPDGLKGEDIPLGARIISIADAFDAIRSARPYKLSLSMEESIGLLRAQAGTMYDPNLVEQFIQHLDELVTSGEEASKDMPQLSFRNYFEKVDLALASANSVASLPSLTPTSSSELVALFEFCNGSGRHLDLADSLPILTRRLKRLLPFSTIAFFLDDGEDSLRAAYVSGKYSDVLQNMAIGYGKGISGWVAAYQRPMFNTGPALEFQEIKGDYTCLSDTLVVPLVADGISLGTISLYGQAPVFYSQTHLAILQMVASQVAPLIAEVKNLTAPSTTEDLIDPVTQTPRAVYLPVSGAQMIAAAEKNQAPMALLYVDLKDYQHLLNLYGLEIGHSILKRVAETLKSELRETDVVVRYGHEGFVALLAGVGGERARRYAQRVQQQIRETPVGEVAGHHIFVAGQTAVASFPENGTTIPALLESAHRSVAEQTRPVQKAAEDDEGNILEFPPRI